jgi:hypothetical protein
MTLDAVARMFRWDEIHDYQRHATEGGKVVALYGLGLYEEDARRVAELLTDPRCARTAPGRARRWRLVARGCDSEAWEGAMKRMTDDEFEAECNAAHVGEPNEVLRWKGMAGVAIREAERARAREARLEAALRPFAEFARRFALKPIPNAARADILYGIHAGEEALEADVRLSHCCAALAALEEAGVLE